MGKHSFVAEKQIFVTIPSTKFTCESCVMLYNTSSFVRAGFCRDPYDAAGNNN